MSGSTNKGIRWDDQPLGKVRDCDLASRLGVHHSTVSRARAARGIPRFGAEADENAVNAQNQVHAAASDEAFITGFTDRLWTAEDASGVFGCSPSSIRTLSIAVIEGATPRRYAFDRDAVALLEEKCNVVMVLDDRGDVRIDGKTFMRTERVSASSGTWMTRPQAAEALGVTVEDIRRMYESGVMKRRGNGRGRNSTVRVLVTPDMLASSAGDAAQGAGCQCCSKIDQIHDMLTRLCAALEV